MYKKHRSGTDLWHHHRWIMFDNFSKESQNLSIMTAIKLSLVNFAVEKYENFRGYKLESCAKVHNSQP